MKSWPLWQVLDCLIYYKKLKSNLYVCLSALHFWNADNSVVFASIGMGLAWNKSCVFEKNQVYFYKPKEPTVHRQECIKDEGITAINHKAYSQWLESTLHIFYICWTLLNFIVHYHCTNSEHQLNTVCINWNRLEIKLQSCLILLHVLGLIQQTPCYMFY